MSCLFHSLSAFIANTDAHALRTMIVDYLATDPLICEGTRLSEILPFEPNSPTLTQYLRTMRLPSTWGGAIEIKAFCDMFDARVVVLVLSTQKTIEFLPSTTTKSGNFRFKVSWNGFHYEPLFH